MIFPKNKALDLLMLQFLVGRQAQKMASCQLCVVVIKTRMIVLNQ
jgi:hypothetical protein